MSGGERALEAYEDLCAVRVHLPASADAALERHLRRVLRAVATPQGSSAEALIQGIGRFENEYYGVRDPERQK